MPRTLSRTAAAIVAACLLVTIFVIAGYLLLSSHNLPDRPTDTPNLAASSPPAAPPNNGLPVVREDAAPPAPPPAAPSPAAPAMPTAAGRSRSPFRLGAICSFDATIYDVRVSPDQIGHIDIDALTKAAATSANFENALAVLGSSRPIYRANQAVSLGEEQYMVITSAPPAATAPATPPGGRPGGAGPKDPGATFDLIAKPGDDAGTIDLEMAVKASILLPAATSAGAAANPPLLRSAQMQQHQAIVPTEPLLFINADAANLDSDGKAVVFIARVILGTPHFLTDEPARPVLNIP